MEEVKVGTPGAMSPGYRVLGLVAALALGAALDAQVATKSNESYQSPQGREALAAALGSPDRDRTQKPGVLIREMGLQPGMTVADVGTGIGYMLPYLSKRVGPEGHVIAEDIFDNFLSAAKQLAQTQDLTNVSFVKGTDADPNLPEGQVDMVLALDVYHHFDFPARMLAAIHKALKPGGKLVVVEYYKRASAMPDGRALTHIRLDMPDAIKEIEANHFHLLEEKEHVRDVQYMLILDKN